jgi:arsenical pump membrane protein
MSLVTTVQSATWAVAALATFGVIARPWRLPEAIWAVLGALALVLLALLPWTSALQAIGKGTDVYLFLVGMMLHAPQSATMVSYGTPHKIQSLSV